LSHNYYFVVRAEEVGVVRCAPTLRLGHLLDQTNNFDSTYLDCFKPN
jgi:hypothetical protein